MWSLLWGLVSVVINNNLSQMMLTVSFFLPICMGYMYKTNVTSEDGIFMSTPVGMLLIFLTVSLLMLILLASKESNQSYYILMHLTLVVLLVMTFSVNNLLAFYILFEACLIPILLMIINWGYQPERLQAGMYMVMYTVISSLPLLVIIMYVYSVSMTYNFSSLFNFLWESNTLLVLGLLAFLVKLPIYGLHIWLPKAHVEAPLGGSMVLAGVLLKLGGYGLYLYNGLISFTWATPLGFFIMLMSLWGGVLASIACMMQVDIKALIAYSSIVHMSMIILGVLSNSTWGLYSAIIIMLAHGWASSALFLLAFITYQLVGSRSFSYIKGMLVFLPALSLLWFSFCMINMGFPPTINFIGEVLIVPVSFLYSWKIFIPVGMIMFMSVVYNMFIYCQLNHGALSNYVMSTGMLLSSRSMLALIGHITPMVFLFSMWMIM